MRDLLTVLVLALSSGAIYALAASGLVVTYTTSGIFNFAHGAIAMFAAFMYWQLRSGDAWHLPAPVALLLVLGVFAPALGYAIDRLIMRRLHDASPITRIVVPIGLLVALIQLASVIWPPDRVNATLHLFFEKPKGSASNASATTLSIGGVHLTYHQVIVFVVALVVALALRLFLYRTRTGIAMRAVVDNRDLAALNGADADRVSSMSWALGSMLAALAGILIAPILALDQVQLTLLVINAYAVAMVGKLRSLPLTVVGALILGLAIESTKKYGNHLPHAFNWITVDTVPVLMLFIVLLVVPQDRESLIGAARDRTRVPMPTVAHAVLAGAGLVAAAVIVPSFVHGNALGSVGYGLALAIVALSLVPLIGFAGQISLAQLGFAGVGAVVMFKVGADGNPLALLAVIVVCAAVGALVALPVLRLRGLYLALATMAFALFLEKAVFTRFDKFKDGDGAIGRIRLPGLSLRSDRANLVVMAFVFAVIGVGVAELRRGPFGRRLQAMKDSPAACTTLGLDLTRTKLQIFALSSAIAGLGGALLGGWRGKAGPEQFSLLQGALPGLPLVLLAVVGGITAVAGALLGGLLLALMPLVGDAVPTIRNLMTVAPGLAGISLARNPSGAVAQMSDNVRALLFRRRRDDDSGADGEEPPDDLRARLVPELVGVGGPASAAELRALDDELGLSWGRCDGDPADQ
ncbi:MAG: branched-chain amino acid ABC-type transport system, permease component [Acidimicrobiales bacterium]|nr:branched-chain amino acid ABC-type transport system, permease component [Acidimicrobiales bacterium]